MKIQIDYDNHQINVEGVVPMGKFIANIKNLLPDWKDWELNANVTINNWSSPIVIDRGVYPWRRWYDYPYGSTQPTWEYKDTVGTSLYNVTNVTYNANAISGVVNLQLGE